MFVILDDFEHRHGIETYSATIAAKLRKQFFDEVMEAQVSVFGAPAVDGLGNAGGFKLNVEDLVGGNLSELQAQADELVAKGNATPGLVGLFNSLRTNTPQLFI